MHQKLIATASSLALCAALAATPALAGTGDYAVVVTWLAPLWAAAVVAAATGAADIWGAITVVAVTAAGMAEDSMAAAGGMADTAAIGVAAIITVVATGAQTAPGSRGLWAAPFSAVPWRPHTLTGPDAPTTTILPATVPAIRTTDSSKQPQAPAIGLGAAHEAPGLRASKPRIALAVLGLSAAFRHWPHGFLWLGI